MLTPNLSTRPFYNERAVYLVLALLALVVVAVAIFNVSRIVRLSRQHTELTTQAERDEARASELEGQAASIQREVSTEELAVVTAAAREANIIIDRRTFSWTELFNRIETTLPRGVMITSIRPDVRDGVISVLLAVIGRSVEDIDAFMENLEESGGFTELLTRQEEATEEGMYRANLLGRYLAERGTQAGVERQTEDVGVEAVDGGEERENAPLPEELPPTPLADADGRTP